MASFDLKRTLQNQNNRSIVTSMLGVTTKYMQIPYTQLVLGNYKKYSIDEQEVMDLAESIASIGLEQNLVVKEMDDPNKYEVVSGHKRTSAILYIFDHGMSVSANVRKNIESPMCIVIPKDEDPLITRFRMHETNVHQRKGFTVAEIEDYIKTIEEAKAKNLEVNGNKIKGTTRAILHQQFGFSEATAKKYIKVLKEGNLELKKSIDDGEISINNAYDVLMGTAEPIVTPKDNEEHSEEKIKAIAENKPKEKKQKEITFKTILKSNRKMTKSVDKIIDDISEWERNSQQELSEEIKEKINEAHKLIAEAEHLLELEEKK